MFMHSDQNQHLHTPVTMSNVGSSEKLSRVYEEEASQAMLPDSPSPQLSTRTPSPSPPSPPPPPPPTSFRPFRPIPSAPLLPSSPPPPTYESLYPLKHTYSFSAPTSNGERVLVDLSIPRERSGEKIIFHSGLMLKHHLFRASVNPIKQKTG